MTLRMESIVAARTTFNGREVDYFSGTGYLGLQSHPAVLSAAQDALQRYGLTTATSRGGYGEHPLYDELERQACAYFGTEKMLYFASGYMGISVLTQPLHHPNDHIFIDSSAHFSLWDAAQATNHPVTPFHHLSADSLAENLRRELLLNERPLVISDGVFPISGEIAPLPDYLALVNQYNGLVLLDDAHAAGVLGEHGRGTPEYYHIDDEHCHTSATLSKALGGYGGVICGAADWIENLDQNARICVGASPPPLTIAAASARALEIARTTPQLRQTLWENVRLARSGLRQLGWELPDTPVPILCLGLRPGINLEMLRTGLFEQGIAVSHVRNYTSTPAGGALRIAIFATHSAEQINHLIEELARML
ncbi:MAG: pyridoxal phosphate-dependent aminotransferase family protein [Anaerolineaceae bacterium]|jgi:glycine C-acetyltransferase/8-amino-7-oxononanoate synthase|nr:pyridoxal phosphate-dependent aminotransferase family protein [Anaerolineaceae bacterium]